MATPQTCKASPLIAQDILPSLHICNNVALGARMIALTITGCLRALKFLKMLKILKKWPFLENMLKILKNHILLKVCGEFAEKGSEIFV